MVLPTEAQLAARKASTHLAGLKSLCRFTARAGLDRGRPREKSGSRPGPSVPGGSWGREGTPPTL